MPTTVTKSTAVSTGLRLFLTTIMIPLFATSLYADSSLFGSIGDQGLFASEYNESWLEYGQTALANPTEHGGEVSIWFKDVSETDIRLDRFRYDYQPVSLLQIGLQGYGSKEQRAHSSYATVKYTIVDTSASPVAVAVGLKRQLYWNSKNPDFETGSEEDSKNESRSRVTLTAAATTILHVAPVDLLVNLYLTNQQLASGVKVAVTPEIKAVLENYYNYYKDPYKRSDTTFAVQFYNFNGIISTLSYEFDSEKTRLGSSFNW